MIRVVQMKKEDWFELAEKAHLITFGEHKPKEWDRIDFALMIENGGFPSAWVTCRETDENTLYWGYGGAFPGARNTSLSYLCYQAAMRFCMEKYQRIWTIIKNDNTVMLKFALKVGYKIIGVRMFSGEVLLELIWERSNA